MAVRNDSSPNRIIRSRQNSLTVLTNLSACAFRFGDRGGSFTDLTPTSATMSKKSLPKKMGAGTWTSLTHSIGESLTHSLLLANKIRLCDAPQR